MDELPYLTTDWPGIGGRIKVVPEDFFVEEIPSYEPCGEGQHVYLTFEKTGMTTLHAINRIAQSLSISSGRIGYAGLKDAHAVTRQTISIDNVSPDQVAELDLHGINVLAVKRHRNKLKLGHLDGNKFKIRIKDVPQTATTQAEQILAVLQKRGVPNYFGEQRFGVRQNSHRLGRALIEDRPDTFIIELLGQPHPDENQWAQQARAAFDAGDLSQALELWPSNLRSELTVLKKLVQTGDERVAMASLHRPLRRLYVSAFQSFLFNKLLAQRLQTLDQVELGDVAYLHNRGAVFVVRDVETEQPRVERFEISPAGPLFGERCLPAEGEPARREAALLQETNVTSQAFTVPSLNLRGARRPYRIPLTDPILSWDEGMIISFTLPAGAYATMVLREIMKDH